MSTAEAIRPHDLTQGAVMISADKLRQAASELDQLKADNASLANQADRMHQFLIEQDLETAYSEWVESR